MKRRDKKRFDYTQYHETGDKIYQNRGIHKMSVTVEVELKLVCKINRFLDEYQLSSFSEVDEIDDCLDKMRVTAGIRGRARRTQA